MPVRIALVVLAVLALAACAAAPTRAPWPQAPPAAAHPAGAALVRAAEALVGVPYRFGGADPGEGFDCSGLVTFVHGRAAIHVPRTARAQHATAVPVARGALAPGDLVFFRVRSRRIDHVGIYVGGGRFVHAPGSGRTVSYADLEDPWYAARFAGAGRFWTPQMLSSAGAASP